VILMSVREKIPGIVACCGVTLCAMALQYAQRSISGSAWIDAISLSIILGTLFHTFFGLDRRLIEGIRFCAKTLLEIAIVLLGATISFAALQSAGYWMIASVAAIVLISLSISYCIGRALGLSTTLATLVACGNSICGNSAIVATAPIIKAKAEDVASSVAFTAALGIVVVLALPFAYHWSGLTQAQYGVVAGMIVYAVPQVLAATLPIGTTSMQIGAIVKLMRVLMLGPVILLISLRSGRASERRIPTHHLVPWFVVGFLLMIGLNSVAIIPHAWQSPINQVSTFLTIVSMAALGLSVNVFTVLMSGGKVLVAGALSLMALTGISILILPLLPI